MQPGEHVDDRAEAQGMHDMPGIEGRSESPGMPPAPDSLPVDAGDGWRRVHPVTPVLLVWQVLVAIFAVLIFQVGQELLGTEGWNYVLDHLGSVLLWVGGGLLLIIAVTGIYSALAWRRMRYRVDADAVELNQGILFRQERRASLARVQAVDVQQPLLGRIFGLARVRVETAGGGDSKVDISFLRLADAEALRAEILARAAGVDLDEVRIVAEAAAAGADVSPEDLRRIAEHGVPSGAAPFDGTGPAGRTGPGGGTGPASGTGPGDGSGPAGGTGPGGGPLDGSGPAGATGPGGASGRLSRFIPGRSDDPLLAARTGYREAPERVVYEIDNRRLVAATVLSSGFIVVALMIVGAAIVLASRAPFGALAAFLPGAISAGGYVWSRFSGSFSFTSATSPDGIRIRRGLLETTSQTVPPRRVQAVRLSQPLLWRWRGWWRVEAYIAGYGSADGNMFNASGTLMPVGTRAEALTAMWLVVPDLGVDDLPTTLDAALDGDGDAAGFITSPRRARWLDPFAWRRQAALVTREAILLRSGWLKHTLEVVPHGRTQSVGLSQGPIERRLQIANLHMHSVPGPGMPLAQHLDEMVALELLRHQAERARDARHREGPEEWARRVAGLVGDQEQADAGGSPAPGSAMPPAPGVGMPSAHTGALPAPGTAATGGPVPGHPAPRGASRVRRGPDGGGWSPTGSAPGQPSGSTEPAALRALEPDDPRNTGRPPSPTGDTDS